MSSGGVKRKARYSIFSRREDGSLALGVLSADDSRPPRPARPSLQRRTVADGHSRRHDHGRSQDLPHKLLPFAWTAATSGVRALLGAGVRLCQHPSAWGGSRIAMRISIPCKCPMKRSHAGVPSGKQPDPDLVVIHLPIAPGMRPRHVLPNPRLSHVSDHPLASRTRRITSLTSRRRLRPPPGDPESNDLREAEPGGGEPMG
jgi:hypothetical protein